MMVLLFICYLVHQCVNLNISVITNVITIMLIDRVHMVSEQKTKKETSFLAEETRVLILGAPSKRTWY